METLDYLALGLSSLVMIVVSLGIVLNIYYKKPKLCYRCYSDDSFVILYD